MALEKWEIDLTHSTIGFSVRHMLVSKVRGRFPRWSAVVELDEKNLAASRVEVDIDVASIDTGVADRDAHLRSADFFDVEKHPKMTYRSRRIERIAGGYRVTGDLTLRGVSRALELEIEDHGRTDDPWGNLRAGFSTHATIDRKDFGLVWNMKLDAGGLVVGDRVDLDIEVEAVQKKAVKAA